MMIGKLKVSTPSDTEIMIVRGFEAPRRLVFDAHTKPELVKRWLYGPSEWPMVECEIDLKVGGRIRYVWRNAAKGADMVMHGKFREIVVPERTVHTELFEADWTGGETVVTTDFTEEGGGTKITIIILYVSKEARDGALKSGMNDGLEQAYTRLDAMLKE
jgi:uncharacterized protein YndB with AHSA1/START domain